MLAETAPLPPEDSLGGHDHEGLPPPGPDSGQPDPEQAIRPAQPRSRDRSLVHGELLAQGEVLQSKLAVAAAEKREESEAVEQESDHRADCLRIRADRSTTCPPDRVLAKDKMFQLPAIEVGDPREHHAREKEECAELRARPQSGGNQIWLFEIATSDGFNIFRGATGEHFHMIRGRTDCVGTASKLLQIVTNARQLE